MPRVVMGNATRDEAVLRKTNAIFEVESTLEQLFLSVFAPAGKDEPGALLLRSTEIMEELQKLPTYTRCASTSLPTLGKVLTHLRLQKVRRPEGTMYMVKRLKND